MSKVWVVVADAGRARIFLTGRNTSSFTEVETLAHPESRLHEQELTTDFPGRSFDSEGAGRHAMVQSTEPKKNQATKFAKILAEKLDSARKQGQFDQIVFIAAPAMLGMLRTNLNEETSKRVVLEVDKDLTQHALEEIRQHLPDYLPI